MNRLGNSSRVSVIITFYNLGKYAENCMQSLIQQDYMNCEFICVDDGSTDDTSIILEKYKEDKRVKIFHKSNGGLSDARNYGINVASGEYITFIDGDDFIHPQYITLMVNAIEEDMNKVAICPLKVVKYSEAMNLQYEWSKQITHKQINKHDVFEKVLYDELSVSACGKLVPKEVYDEIRFPVGLISEEVATIGQLLRRYDTYSIIDQPLYGYVMRPNSIGHKKKVPFKDIQDRIDALKILEEVTIQEFNIDEDQSIRNAIQYRWGLRYVDMASMYTNVSDNIIASRKIKEEVSIWLKTNIDMIMKNSKAPFLQRVRMWVYTFAPELYVILYAMYQKMKYNV